MGFRFEMSHERTGVPRLALPFFLNNNGSLLILFLITAMRSVATRDPNLPLFVPSQNVHVVHQVRVSD
jgi:hypothetical protein